MTLIRLMSYLKWLKATNEIQHPNAPVNTLSPTHAEKQSRPYVMSNQRCVTPTPAGLQQRVPLREWETAERLQASSSHR